eukprot:4463014-Prymnesium_polylepis.1
MEVSVLYAVKLNMAATAERRQPVVLETMKIWLGRGQSIEPFLLWLDEAHMNSAHNGLGFDMIVLRKHYTSLKRWFQHMSKMFDTLVHLRAKNYGSPLDLGSLLEANGGAKGGKGSEREGYGLVGAVDADQCRKDTRGRQLHQCDSRDRRPEGNWGSPHFGKPQLRWKLVDGKVVIDVSRGS